MINVSSERHELETQIYNLFKLNNYSKYNFINLLYIKSFTKNLANIIKNITKVETIIEVEKYSTIRAAYCDFNNTIYIRIPKKQLLDYFKYNIFEYQKIVDLSVHELIHYKQCQKDKKRNIKIYFGVPREQYISTEKEIEAWAAFTASDFLRKYNKTEILYNLKYNHKNLNNSIFEMFTNFKYNSPKIWKKFINKVVLHLNLMAF